MDAKDILRKNAAYGVGVVVGLGACYIYDRLKKDKVVIIPPEPEERRLQIVEEREHTGLVLDRSAYEELTSIDYTAPEFIRQNDELIQLQDQVTESYRQNVFAKPDGDWDYEAELSTRNPLNPYILHRDEFMGNEMDYRQETMTYYAGDNVMVDPQDNPIYNYPDLMGELHFGHGSNDPNVVYIRNEGIHMEWEVLLSTGTYAYEVMGLAAEAEAEDELRHSGPLKFRRD